MLEKLDVLPTDPILGMNQLFAADSNPLKVNLSVGVYQDSNGHTPIPRAVKQAEAKILERQDSKSYIPQAGDAIYINGLTNLLTDGVTIDKERLQLIATPGGCGGLRMASELLAKSNKSTTVWLSNPSWANHKPLIEASGLQTRTYDYYDFSTGEVNFDAMMQSLEPAQAGDCLLLHACCHNPTGADLTSEQWLEIIDFCKRKGLFPFLDMAYQGLGKGLKEDNFAVQTVLEQCSEAVIVVSCSKNFGLYRERTGALMVLSLNAKQSDAARSHVLNNARCSYSMAPYHGCSIVGAVLSDKSLSKLWKDELESMRLSIIKSRNLLADSLNQNQSKRDYNYLKRNGGMFSYLGLSKEQVIQLREQYSIYMLESSRINVIGIQPSSLEYTIDSIVKVCG